MKKFVSIPTEYGSARVNIYKVDLLTCNPLTKRMILIIDGAPAELTFKDEFAMIKAYETLDKELEEVEKQYNRPPRIPGYGKPPEKKKNTKCRFIHKWDDRKKATRTCTVCGYMQIRGIL
jgi:hypothetical protein